MATYRKLFSVVVIFFGSLLLIATIIGSATYFAYQSIPSIENINGCFTASMYQVPICPSKPGYIRYSQLPRHLVQSLIAAEDSTFYFHQGFNLEEMKDALEKSLDAGRWVRGGSTITQQLAKNLYLTKEKSLVRKIKELVVSRNIEKKLSKEKIIELYFNVVEFGPKIYGISKASRHYFDKSPGELTPAEGAYLVSLLPSPVRYSSQFRKNKELSAFNKRRIKHILHILLLQKKVSEDDYNYEVARTESGLWNVPPEVIDPDSVQFAEKIFGSDGSAQLNDANPEPTENESKMMDKNDSDDDDDDSEYE
ncbi:MAG: transglycosylase domain-containing protein [Bdellovibrionaceae bacterium]|nr:transglycosylase domain-containing protein [Pseudobdellovibrionaceae bacterium]